MPPARECDGRCVFGWIGRSARVFGVTDARRRLEAQQMAAGDKQIGERTGHHQAMRVLLKPAIAHFGKAEDSA